MKKDKKEKRIDEMIRKPIAPPTIRHKDKNKYSRKKKHKNKESEQWKMFISKMVILTEWTI